MRMADKPEEVLSEVCWLHDFLLQLFLLAYLLVDEPLSLFIGHIGTSKLLLFFDLVEIVYNHSNKHVHDEQGACDHDYNKVDGHIRIIVLEWLHINSSRVYCHEHKTCPTLCCAKDEQSTHCLSNVVKVRVIVVPRTSGI